MPQRSEPSQPTELAGQVDGRVAALHAQFLARAGAGEALSLREFCAEHAAHSEALLAFHEEHVQDLMVEFLEQQANGAVSDLDEFCNRHPVVAADLRRLSKHMAAFSNAFAGESPGGVELERTQFGRFRVVGSIGRGAMGEVFRVWDDQLRREVALKVMRVIRGIPNRDSAQARARFIEEAQVTAQLDHPAIVPVHELHDSPDGPAYFTMKFVKGRSLEEIMNERLAGESQWSTTRDVRIVLRVAEALAYAHSKGVLHRDLKPSNVMVGRFGAVFVMDWGLSKVIDSLPTHIELGDGEMTRHVESVRSRPPQGQSSTELSTKAGAHVGTPFYMAPEQARGDSAEMTPLVDVYGLGAVLYHILAGSPPYQDTLGDKSVWQLLLQIESEPPTPLHELAPKVPHSLVRIVERAMAHDPSRRFASMELLAGAIDSVLACGLDPRRPDEASSVTSATPEPSLLRRHGVLLALGAGLIFVLGLWTMRLLDKTQ